MWSSWELVAEGGSGHGLHRSQRPHIPWERLKKFHLRRTANTNNLCLMICLPFSAPHSGMFSGMILNWVHQISWFWQHILLQCSVMLGKIWKRWGLRLISRYTKIQNSIAEYILKLNFEYYSCGLAEACIFQIVGGCGREWIVWSKHNADQTLNWPEFGDSFTHDKIVFSMSPSNVKNYI